jgi:hypothetical protein
VVLGQGSYGTDEHGVEAGVGQAFLADLVDHLEHGQARSHPIQIFTNGPEGVEHLNLIDGVEITTTLPPQQGDMAQGLEAGAELRRRPTHPLGYGTHLAVLLGHQRDDAVGLT